MVTAFGLLCDHVAAILYDRPIDRDELRGDVIRLLAICSRIRSAAHQLDATRGSTERGWAIGMAVTACERRLHLLSETKQAVSDESFSQTLDRVLRLLMLTFHVLEDPAVTGCVSSLSLTAATPNRSTVAERSAVSR